MTEYGEPCGALADYLAFENQQCTEPAGHQGPHSWQVIRVRKMTRSEIEAFYGGVSA